MKVIAKIHNNYNSKFGIPRQSGLIEGDKSVIVFEPEYRVPESLRGLDTFTYLWLIWEFSECEEKEWHPTVRPPRLGGNKRMGVFATRSPFRPNPIGLSSVKIEEIVSDSNDGPVIIVSGADLMDGTPIYDIKPYLPYVDSHPEAENGFALSDKSPVLSVIDESGVLSLIDDKSASVLTQILSQDPRPQYIDDCERVYGMNWGDYEIKFKVKEKTLTILSIQKS